MNKPPTLAILARQIVGAMIGVGGVGANAGNGLPTWASITLLGVGLAVGLGDHLLAKGTPAVNLDSLLNDFKDFLVKTTGSEEAAVAAITGTAADKLTTTAQTPPAAVVPASAAPPVGEGLASVLASVGAAPATTPEVPATPAPVVEPIVQEAAAVAEPVVQAVANEGVKTFDDLVGDLMDALRLAPTTDQLAKVHDFSVNLLKLVGVQL